MNSRKFFKWLGTGVAVAAIAPTALLAEDPSLSGWHWDVVHADAIGEYVDYSNFSQFAITSSIDESVANVAKELSHRAGLSKEELIALSKDAERVA